MQETPDKASSIAFVFMPPHIILKRLLAARCRQGQSTMYPTSPTSASGAPWPVASGNKVAGLPATTTLETPRFDVT